MKLDKHTCILGTTDTGKTWYGVYLYIHLNGTKIFFNTAFEPIVEKYSKWGVSSIEGLHKILKSVKKPSTICFTPSVYDEEKIQQLEILQKYLFEVGRIYNITGKRKRWCYLFIDEAHLFGGKKGTPALNTLVTGGLRHGVVVISLAQRPALLSHTVLTQSPIHVYFNMEIYEMLYLKKYGFPYETEIEWIKQPYHFIEKKGLDVKRKKPISL